MMATKGRILIVEDDPNWSDKLKSLLTSSGYDADVAETIDDALSIVKNRLYHVVLLDMELPQNSTSRTKTSDGGIQIVRELEKMGLSEAIEKIGLTKDWTPKNMHSAFANHFVADFLPKGEFDNDKFLEVLTNVFLKRVQINFDLEIAFTDNLTYEELANDLVPREQKEMFPSDRVVDEIKDLLQRLFHDARKLVLRRLAQGHSKTRVVSVEPYYKVGGHGERVVLKLGLFSKIDKEYRNYDKYVRQFIYSHRATDAYYLRRTPMLGGILYRLIGSKLEVMSDLRVAYQKHDPNAIGEILTDLFRNTCSNWYAERGSRDHVDLTDDYTQLLQFTSETLVKALQDNFPYYVDSDLITFRELPGKSFKNAVYSIAKEKLSRSTYKCITHGDLNPQNIFISPEHRTWLIDFYRTGYGHILRDFTQLEAVVKFILLEDESLARAYDLEEKLASLRLFSDLDSVVYNAPNEQLEKAFRVIVKIRQLARAVVTPSDDMEEYTIGLIYHTVNTIRFYSLPKIRRLHALMSAGLLCTQINLG